MKKALALVLLGGALIGAWFYWSPRAAARDLRNAAETGDVEELQKLVDFPTVREHLKADLKVSMMRSMDTTDQSGLGALGTAFGGVMMDGLVNEVVSPSGIAALVRHGSVDTTSTASRPRTVYAHPDGVPWLKYFRDHNTRLGQSAFRHSQFRPEASWAGVASGPGSNTPTGS